MYTTPHPKPPKREAKARRPLLRKKYMKKRKPRRLSRAGSDKPFLAWLHWQPCVGHRLFHGGNGTMGHYCAGGIQASHLRHHTGMARKEPDRRAVAMCRDLHEQWEQHRGWFAGLSNMERFAWFTQRIEETQNAYKRDTGELA